MANGNISVLIFVFVIIFYIVFTLVRKWFIKRKLQNFESPKETPILGVASHFLGKSHHEYVDVFFYFFNETKTTPFQMWLGPFLAIGISEPEDIRIILTRGDCLNRPYIYKFFLGPTTILAIDKEMWKPHRRALNATFKPKVLRSFVPFLNEKSRILISKMESFLEKDGDIYHKIFAAHLDTISRTLLGVDMNFQHDNSLAASFTEFFRLSVNIIQNRIVKFWYHFDWIFNWSKIGREQQDFVNKMDTILEFMYHRKKKEIKDLRPADLQRIEEENLAIPSEKLFILEQNGIFTHQTVLEYMRSSFIGGVDTSSTAVFGTLLMLAMNQHHQELVVEELRSIFESDDCDVTLDHLIRVSYLERAIKETMRLMPPAPIIARDPSADIELARGTIPKGTFIFINIMHLHRNPKIWGENALEFDPDRFLPDNVAKRPPFSYIPFGGGVRNCLGAKYAMMSAKIVLANLLRRYKFMTDLKFEDIHLKVHIFLEITNKNALQIEERNFSR